jgi:uncharacterized protein
MNIFLDTNAIVKLYHKEHGTTNLNNFIEDNKDDLILTITDLSKLEFHSVFYKEVRTGNFEIGKALEVFSLFNRDLNSFNIIEITSNIKEFAVDLLNKYGIKNSLRTLDSMQLAGAIYFDNFFKVDYFISSDKKLLNVAKDFFFTFNPED